VDIGSLLEGLCSYGVFFGLAMVVIRILSGGEKR